MKNEDDSDFNRVMAGLTDALAHAEGRGGAVVQAVAPAEVNVKAIRSKLKLSQGAFATRFGFSVGSVRDWEQGRKRPEPVARVLLTVIDKEPEAVERALA